MDYSKKMQKMINKNYNIIMKRELTQYLVVGLLLFFIFSGMSVPEMLAEYIDTPLMKILLYVFAGSLLLYHPVLGAVSLFFVYELIERSSKKTGSYYIQGYLPSEQKKTKQFIAMNDFPVTLEEEVVSKLVPMAHEGMLISEEYKPVMNKLHNAAKL